MGDPSRVEVDALVENTANISGVKKLDLKYILRGAKKKTKRKRCPLGVDIFFVQLFKDCIIQRFSPELESIVPKTGI